MSVNPTSQRLRAAVIGSGPNGLAGAVVLARAGVDVTVYEGAQTPGGGLRTSPFGPKGYVRDVCSAVHPMVLPSPFFRRLGIHKLVKYRIPEMSYAHAIRPGESAYAYRNISKTASSLGKDGSAWTQLLEPLASHIEELLEIALNPVFRYPQHLSLTAQLGMRVLEQSTLLRNIRWKETAAPALLAGVLAHGNTKLPSFSASAAGIVLAAAAHSRTGWPIPLGGARVLAKHLIDDLESHGGRIRLNTWVNDLRELKEEIILADTSAMNLQEISYDRIPARLKKKMNQFRYGQGVNKIDVTLDGPIPWADPQLLESPTVHLGGTQQEVFSSENTVMQSRFPKKPFTFVVQPSVVDRTRAPEGKHVLWAYCHAPSNNTADLTESILSRIEQYAPGVRQLVTHVEHTSAHELGNYNPNYPGGDIASGLVNMKQLFFRPLVTTKPWRVGPEPIYLAGASAVPGPGVHGMPGYLAAIQALKDHNIEIPDEFI